MFPKIHFRKRYVITGPSDIILLLFLWRFLLWKVEKVNKIGINFVIELATRSFFLNERLEGGKKDSGVSTIDLIKVIGKKLQYLTSNQKIQDTKRNKNHSHHRLNRIRNPQKFPKNYKKKEISFIFGGIFIFFYLFPLLLKFSNNLILIWTISTFFHRNSSIFPLKKVQKNCRQCAF